MRVARAEAIHDRVNSGDSLLLAVFDASLDVRVGCINQISQCRCIDGSSRPELHMTHELTGPLQQTGRIRQRRALKEADVRVGSEHVHITEGNIPQTYDRTAVM